VDALQQADIPVAESKGRSSWAGCADSSCVGRWPPNSALPLTPRANHSVEARPVLPLGRGRWRSRAILRPHARTGRLLTPRLQNENRAFQPGPQQPARAADSWGCFAPLGASAVPVVVPELLRPQVWPGQRNTSTPAAPTKAHTPSFTGIPYTPALYRVLGPAPHLPHQLAARQGLGCRSTLAGVVFSINKPI